LFYIKTQCLSIVAPKLEQTWVNHVILHICQPWIFRLFTWGTIPNFWLPFMINHCRNTEYCQIVSHILLNKWDVSVSQDRIPVVSYQWNIKNNNSDTRVMEKGKRHMRHLSKNNEEKSNSKYLTIESSRHTPRCSTWQ
jgi:hypothetical protein